MALDCTPVELDCTPVGLDCTPVELDCTLVHLDCILVELDCTPVRLDCTPVKTDCTPVKVDCTPVELNCTVVELDCTPVALDCTLVALDCTTVYQFGNQNLSRSTRKSPGARWIDVTLEELNTWRSPGEPPGVPQKHLKVLLDCHQRPSRVAPCCLCDFYAHGLGICTHCSRWYAI